ncbi:hypothetical protein BK816_04710 [Boudabousia tangfeifanii]|uniref:DUF3710 domain-containing protein n=1 Tax=Boudabousia tangfeifanii TaxID=1912795 RepID=A0A1D9MK68_9ACTO|nr:DUF3710 domain-containing protein [Boudabousia tangfeifanii]AOZ72676.1 hypothetical protein BK816_04710 [Boudabousia tangfeifanii]
MGLFSRKSKAKTEPNEPETAETVAGKLPEEDERPKLETPFVPDNTVGPKSLGLGEEIPDGYGDLGILKIKAVPGMQVNLGSEDETQPPFHQATFLIQNSAVQVTVFAIPKGEDGWQKIKSQLAEMFADRNYLVKERETRYGQELFVEAEVRTPDGRLGVTQMRVAGVTGERWACQFTVYGPAVDPESESAQKLDEFLDEMLISRGNTPMPPYRPIALTPPQLLNA